MPDLFWTYELTILISMVVVMAITWAIHIPLKRADIVDAVWALSLGGAGVMVAAVAPGDLLRRFLLSIMTGIWGLRLGFHLLLRIASHQEDGRYQKMRADWKTGITKRFFFFFQSQALLNVILCIPFVLAALNPNPIGITEWIAVTLFAIALIGEAIADTQLRSFKANPENKGKVCQAGLWNYSRHPNYFFEWLIWAAFFLFSITSPGGWIGIVCPVLMFYFLWYVTGIPLSEAQSVLSKGPAYTEYQRTTSAFVPWKKIK